MISLLVMVLVTSPPIKKTVVLKHCISACWNSSKYYGVLDCVYYESVSCGRDRECIPSETVDCRPIVVNLGPWAPVLLDYKPSTYQLILGIPEPKPATPNSEFSAPTPSTESYSYSSESYRPSRYDVPP